LLGVKEPWYIAEVVLNQKEKRVDVYVDHRRGTPFACPECGSACGVYDHMKERAIRHLNTCHLATYIHVRFPRIDCPVHGVCQIDSDWGEEAREITYELECFVIDLEQECSIESTSRLTGLSWHTCWDVMDRGVQRGLSRKEHRIPERLGVDEKSFAKGHRYETLVYDIDAGTVEAVLDNREQNSLEQYYEGFTQAERSAVKSVAMDMWDPYIAATKSYIPEAEKKIVFDRFHVMCHVLDAVDKVRKQENQALLEQDVDLLKGTKYLWLWSEENIPAYRKAEFEALRAKDLKVCRARAIKENLRHLWSYRKEGWMRRFFRDWYWWATHSRLKPVIDAAKTLKRHLDNIVTYAKHRITNALGESLNSKIEKVKRMACGYRNRNHYKIAILFHCGGLNLYPRKPSVATA